MDRIRTLYYFFAASGSGEIIRVKEHGPGIYCYGFLFAQLSDLELAHLIRTLYNILHDNLDTWKRSKVGYWGLEMTGPIS